MPRVVSFLVLLAIVVLVGAVFFQVMAQFMVPLFLACVLLVIFQPLHRWLTSRLPNRPRLAALLTTALILLVVLLPAISLGWKAFIECQGVYDRLEEGDGAELAQRLSDRGKEVVQWFERVTHKPLDIDATIENATSQIGSAVLAGLQTSAKTLIGLLIMVISLYYFLADGPAMIQTLMRLSPLDKRYELELLIRFGEVSRAVVLATLLSAVAQGTLAGIGYFFALPSGAPIFLLTAATMVLAIVPFVGAAGVWVFVCGWIYLYGERIVDGQTMHDGNSVVALVLAIYCAVVVSGIDNVIKPLVLHGQSNLHPLLALLSILGGVTVLGPVGILVGPMVVSFLQALLNMLQRELEGFGNAKGNATAQLASAAATAASAIPSASADGVTEKKSGSKPSRKAGK